MDRLNATWTDYRIAPFRSVNHLPFDHERALSCGRLSPLKHWMNHSILNRWFYSRDILLYVGFDPVSCLYPTQSLSLSSILCIVYCYVLTWSRSTSHTIQVPSLPFNTNSPTWTMPEGTKWRHWNDLWSLSVFPSSSSRSRHLHSGTGNSSRGILSLSIKIITKNSTEVDWGERWDQWEIYIVKERWVYWMNALDYTHWDRLYLK